MHISDLIREGARVGAVLLGVIALGMVGLGGCDIVMKGIRRLRRELSEAGYQVEVVSHGRQAVKRVAQGPVGLVVLNVGLPRTADARSVQRILGKNDQVPIILNGCGSFAAAWMCCFFMELGKVVSC